ncbi:flagellar biosynthesis anti-sigma factor FlgM [Vagococcus fluvialis]|uniref:flagellar biosynthesis anti-sigma factor FlgM n=1 Tax=Vagococcus fluvialis TaxID=2738 RepID=UPI003D11BE2D
MKVNNQYTSYFESYHSQLNQYSKENEYPTTTKKESVEINLSRTSKQIRLNTEVDDSNNSKRVEEIKQAVKDGTYKVSAKEIANKMLEMFKGQED